MSGQCVAMRLTMCVFVDDGLQYGRTALICAVKENNEAIVQSLLSTGCDIHAKDRVRGTSGQCMAMRLTMF